MSISTVSHSHSMHLTFICQQFYEQFTNWLLRLNIVLHCRWCHLVSFTWCFGYIAFFRTAHMFGLPEVVPHANAVQLFLTLRVMYNMLLLDR